MAVSVVLCLVSVILFTLSAVFRSHDRESIRALAEQASALAQDGKNAKIALCALKSDLQRRYDDGVNFLAKHPNGIPGVSSADIERSLANQQSTLDALSLLTCP